MVLPIAETTTTTSSPARRVRTMCSATARMRSGSATEVPPNFWTSKPTARQGTGAVRPARVPRYGCCACRLRRRAQGRQARAAEGERARRDARREKRRRQRRRSAVAHRPHDRPSSSACRVVIVRWSSSSSDDGSQRRQTAKTSRQPTSPSSRRRMTIDPTTTYTATIDDRACGNDRRRPRREGRTEDGEQLRVPRQAGTSTTAHVPPRREGLRDPGRRPEGRRKRRARVQVPAETADRTATRSGRRVAKAGTSRPGTFELAVLHRDRRRRQGATRRPAALPLLRARQGHDGHRTS